MTRDILSEPKDTPMIVPRIENKRRFSKLRRGFTALEILVAASLLIVSISGLSVLTARIGKAAKIARHYQIAVHELANQLEQITTLSEPEVERAIRNLRLTPEIQDVIPEATLTGEIIADADGKRIALSIHWQHVGASVPLTLVAWIDTTPQPSSKESHISENGGQL